MATSTLVNISEGTVQGKELTASSFSRKKYFAFQGIPYAQPPVGNLRFKVNFLINIFAAIQYHVPITFIYSINQKSALFHITFILFIVLAIELVILSKYAVKVGKQIGT